MIKSRPAVNNPAGGDLTDADIRKSTAKLDALCGADRNSDVIRRGVTVAGRAFALYFIEGLCKDGAVQHLTDTLYQLDAQTVTEPSDIAQICRRCVSAAEVFVISDYGEAVDALLSGMTLLLCDGAEGCVCADCRGYPHRSITEPENDKVLRGPRVGFTETLINNTALIRRHIRDPRLVVESHRVGRVSHTGVVICYMDGAADPDYVEKLRDLIDSADTDSLTMGAQSLAECLIKKKWYDPFPKIRYTERPDCAAAHILEGRVAVIVDNCPSVMILPSAIFDFIQETDDYYLPPPFGTYIRAVRCTVFFLTLFLSPLWYLLICYPQWIPDRLAFIIPEESGGLPVIVQLYILEFAVDGLKLAALNTPSMLSGSFSIIGGLIIGDFAVRVGWFIPDTILYMAFVAVANFAQPSYELGYAFKFLRLLLLLLTALFGAWGFCAGVAAFLLLLATNKTVGGKSYLYPLIPFDGAALFRHMIRRRKRK